MLHNFNLVKSNNICIGDIIYWIEGENFDWIKINI